MTRTLLSLKQWTLFIAGWALVLVALGAPKEPLIRDALLVVHTVLNRVFGLEAPLIVLRALSFALGVYFAWVASGLETADRSDDDGPPPRNGYPDQLEGRSR